MMLGGLLAVLGWKYGLGYGAGLYEALPGMLTSFRHLHRRQRVLWQMSPSAAREPGLEGLVAAHGATARVALSMKC